MASDATFGEPSRTNRDGAPEPHPPLQPPVDERTSEEIVSQLREINPEEVVGLKIFGDGLRWEWDKRRDRSRNGMTAREMVLRIERFLTSLGLEDVFAVPATFRIFSHVVRHGVLISLQHETTFRFEMTLLGQMHPDEPSRRAVEELFSIWPPRLGAIYEPPYGPQPLGATVPRFFRTISEPSNPLPTEARPWLFVGPPEHDSVPDEGPSFTARSVGNWYLRHRGGREGRISTARLQRLAFLVHGWHLWAYGRPLLSTPFVIETNGPVSPELSAAFDGKEVEKPARIVRVTHFRGPFPPMEWSAIPIIVDPGAEEILEFVWDLPEDMSFSVPHPIGTVLTDQEIHAEFQRRAAMPEGKVFRTFHYYERTPFPS